jgi:hypothetical protein
MRRINSPDDPLGKRATEVGQTYALCNAAGSRAKICKIASNEEPLDICSDYQWADKPTNVESPISDTLNIPKVLEPFVRSGQPF